MTDESNSETKKVSEVNEVISDPNGNLLPPPPPPPEVAEPPESSPVDSAPPDQPVDQNNNQVNGEAKESTVINIESEAPAVREVPTEPAESKKTVDIVTKTVPEGK